MKKGDYPKVQAGEWVQPSRKGYFMGCCDCGLVHKMQFRLFPNQWGPGKKIQFRAWRDEKETKALRREPHAMKFDPAKMTLEEVSNVFFAKAKEEGVQLRVKFIYPKPVKPAKKKAKRRGAPLSGVFPKKAKAIRGT
jgi:hypothetical protein